MTQWRELRVWLKRRRNPPKKDGSRTVSYTLQWRDENYEERFESLGADVTEEAAEAKRSEFAKFLNGDQGDDPQQFIERMSKRNQQGVEKVKLVAGDDPRRWPFEKMFGSDPKVWHSRFHDILVTLETRPTEDAETLLQQFKVQHPAEYEVLLDTHNSEEFLRNCIKKFLLFHPGEVVWNALLNHAKEWEWSSDPSRFIEQFRSRYPSEFEKVEQELSLEDEFKKASLPPKEIARRLRAFARGDLDIHADETRAPGRSIILPSEME